MLPPHRPFRDKPVRKVAVKKKSAHRSTIDPAAEAPARGLKGRLVVLERATASAAKSD